MNERIEQEIERLSVGALAKAEEAFLIVPEEWRRIQLRKHLQVLIARPR